MKVVSDEAMGDWLEMEFARQSIDWDEYNVPKLSKHSVSKEEINLLFENDFFFVGRILEPEGIDFGEKRYLIIGVFLTEGILQLSVQKEKKKFVLFLVGEC